jgi:hypothetical protein
MMDKYCRENPLSNIMNIIIEAIKLVDERTGQAWTRAQAR